MLSPRDPDRLDQIVRRRRGFGVEPVPQTLLIQILSKLHKKDCTLWLR